MKLLCLYNSVYVGPVRKPHCFFSHDAAEKKLTNEQFYSHKALVRLNQFNLWKNKQIPRN